MATRQPLFPLVRKKHPKSWSFTEAPSGWPLCLGSSDAVDAVTQTRSISNICYVGVSLNVWIPVHTKYTCILLLVCFFICTNLFFHTVNWHLQDLGAETRTVLSWTSLIFGKMPWPQQICPDEHEKSGWHQWPLKSQWECLRNNANITANLAELLILAPAAQEAWDDQYFSSAPSPSKHIQVGLANKPQAIPTKQLGCINGTRLTCHQLTNVQHKFLLNNACRCMASNFDGQRVSVWCHIDDW